LRRREPTVIYMDILAALAERPRSPTRLAQACNVNYARFERFASRLEETRHIRKEATDEGEVYALTDLGYRLYEDWLALWRRLPLD
jgi:predicted transcriptional regulator